ncbi:MAG: pyruvate kinase [Candidatus Gracilibacteria bacterium]|nr:pyruvate kinase [Candidatus Gracilibacteria bacterium]
MKKTKIITTLGPATATKEKIEALYKAGANVVRLNYSHTDYNYFTGIINNVIELNKEGKTNLGILTDTKGPEIRTKKIDEKIILDKDEIFLLSTLSKEINIKNTNKKIISCDYDYIISDLDIGHIIDIDTGLLKAEVISKDSNFLTCKALNSHIVGSKRHLNLPGIKIKLPGITDSDKEDIKFAVGLGTDFIAMSFVRNRENILELKNYLKEINAPKYIQIISKIENKESLDNIDEIIAESHGIMIARGDLGAEIPYETLPIVQRMIATKCKNEGKFFIVATQMLETMITNPIPTRAEVTDIFNAAMQKADCTMLSGESAAGNYPIEAVKTMSDILEYTESQITYKHDYFSRNLGNDEEKKQLIKNVVYTAENINAKNIIVFTNTGFMAKTIAAFRPNMHVFAFTYTDFIRKKLTILFGLKTFLLEKKSNSENLENAIAELKRQKLIEIGDKIVTIYDIEKDNINIPSIQIIEIR